jgi:hypothetical protein
MFTQNEQPLPQVSQNPTAAPDVSTPPAQPNTEQSKSVTGPLADREKPIPEETLIEWSSPNRPFKKRKPKFFSNIAIIVLLVCLILFFAGQFLPIAVVISIAFLVYVLYTVPPGISNHKITNYGIYTDDLSYSWDEIGRYWFDTKLDQDTINFEVGRFPGRITLLLGTKTRKEFETILDQGLVQERPPDTLFDKYAKWLQEKVPLE